MPLSPEYMAALEALGRVCEEYRKSTGAVAYLVGGRRGGDCDGGRVPVRRF